MYTWAPRTMPPPDYSSSAMRDRRMRQRQWGKIYESNPAPLLTADRRGSQRRIFIVAPVAVTRNQTFQPIKYDATDIGNKERGVSPVCMLNR